MKSAIFAKLARPCLVDGKHTPGSEWEKECSQAPRERWSNDRRNRACRAQKARTDRTEA